MTKEELIEKIKLIQQEKTESAVLECKAAQKGCPKKLYDTLSSFSNQDEGGTIFFGIDEENGFAPCGVYNAQDLQKKISEQCLQMQPPVRPLITIAKDAGKSFVSAEIPGIDLSERPCYYKGAGINRGTYIRVGDNDEPMTPYEIYSYEAYRKKYQDDIRKVARATQDALDKEKLERYLDMLKRGKPNFQNLKNGQICELMGITQDGEPTLNAILLFCPYPQAYMPQLCITAVSVPGMEIGETGRDGERFLDNKRIEGSVPEMLDGAMKFVEQNIRRRTIIDPATGKRVDRPEYPMLAVREAVLNALVHRDYSIHTEGMPIQLQIFADRFELQNPGGIYGRIRLDQLGKAQPDTRNPVLATALEVLGVAENRYSGIPTIRRTMREYDLEEPEFRVERGNFVVRFYRSKALELAGDDAERILQFCRIPRTRGEISRFLGISTEWYVLKKYIEPLVEGGRLGVDNSGARSKWKYGTK